MTRPTTTGKAQDLITFTRSTTGTYLGSDGLLKSAAINEARIEYDASGNCLGLLVEEARTNQATHSEDWTVSAWGLMPNSFRNSTNSIAPDGTAGATRFYTNSNVPAFLQQICPGSVGAKTHIVSCWARSTNGGADQTFRLKNTHAAVTDFYSDNKTATSEWQRFIFTTTFISASNTAVIAGVVEDSSTNQFDIEVWGMQVEFDTSFPTSYIPTSGSAVTRAADLASLAVSEFGYNQDQGTVVVSGHYTGLGVSATSGVFELNQAVSAPYGVELRLHGANSTLMGYDNNGAFLTGGDVPVNSDFKIALGFVVGGTNAAASYNGSVTNAYASVDVNTVSSIELFKHDTNLGRILNGHLKSVQYYPLRLSNAQLQALTV
jgi:hypothetical protein